MATGSAASHHSEQHVSSDGSEHSSLRPSNAADAASSKEDLDFALRTVAVALKPQAALQENVANKWTTSEARTKTLSTIKIPPPDGHPSTTVKAYRDRKKDITTPKLLNKLNDEELALMLCTSFTGRTKQLV